MREGVDKINEMFNVNWTVDFSSSWKKLRTEIKLTLDSQKKEIKSDGRTESNENGGDDNEDKKE